LLLKIADYRLVKLKIIEWVIERIIPSINPMTFSMAFTQMEDFEGRKYLNHHPPTEGRRGQECRKKNRIKNLQTKLPAKFM
jgi:hypothetical protein